MTNAVRLYYTEPARLSFDARVVDVEPDVAAGRVRVALDRTAFYPTSGGQPHDVGTLGAAQVLDVVDDEDGRVWHLVDRSLVVGERVEGVIDTRRRRDHMQQHTGQHILSAAFDRVAGVRTESFHLGAEDSTIDLSREVSTLEATRATEEANRVVWDDRHVTIRFVSAEEAALLPLRKEPARGGRLRLIEVADFDLSACGGTHVARTGEVGMIAVRRVERFKGGSRVTFVCGARALRVFEEMRDVLERASRPLSVGASDLPDAIGRLQASAKDQRRVMKAMSSKLATFEATQLAHRAMTVGSRIVAAECIEGLDASDLKVVATGFVATPGRIAVLLGTGEPAPVVVARSADVMVDAAELLKMLTTRLGGRGGGRPELAQGAVTATPERVVAEAVSLIS